MNKILKLLIFIGLLTTTLSASSQDTTSVLDKDLKGEYTGNIRRGLASGEGFAKGIDSYKGSFKKGLPHGVGKYVWSTGEIYIGEWYKGKMSGEGTYILNIDGKDSSIMGIWKEGKYMGVRSQEPRITRYHNVDNFSFTNNTGTQNRVLMNFTQNGRINNRIENLMITASNGTRTSSGQLVGFDNIIFPVTITARYDTYNKLGTQQVNAFLEFTIYEIGDWLVTIKN